MFPMTKGISLAWPGPLLLTVIVKPIASGGVSVLDVPIRLRAQVGTAELSLGEVGGEHNREKRVHVPRRHDPHAAISGPCQP